MTPFGKLLALALSLGLALGVSAAPLPETPAADKNDTKQIRDDIKLLREQLKEDIRDLRIEATSRHQKTQGDINDLRAKIDKLEKDLAALKGQRTTTSFYGPPETGTLQIDNQYFQPVEVVINGTAYRVEPTMIRVVKLPPGPFTFRIPSVPAFQSTQSRVLTGGAPYMIRIYPQW